LHSYTNINNMIKIQKYITSRLIKEKNTFLDLLVFLVFEKQNSIKFVQKKNYKNTSFFHTNYLRNYN